MEKETMLDRLDTEVKLEGALSAEQRAKLIEVGGRCPVHRTLTAGIHVTTVGV